MDAKTAKKIGKYTILPQELGSGSFSVVYKARDAKKRQLAAKVISIVNLESQDCVQLQREINCLRRCANTNVVELIDVMKTKNNLYIFMELCPDGSLEKLLEKRGRLTEDEAMNYFSQIVKGLQVLSASGVVHRDLKPANLLISGKTIKIGDFGLARKFDKGTLLTSYKGTPLNMAPEILHKREYTQRVDVYSAGTILFQMLYGQCPYQASSEAELAMKIQKGLKIKKVEGVSDRVKQLIMRMLDRDPSTRIDLGGVLDFVGDYVERSKEEKVKKYKVMLQEVVGGVGVMGAIAGAFKWSHQPAEPMSMDLRLYGRLCGRLSMQC